MNKATHNRQSPWAESGTVIRWQEAGLPDQSPVPAVILFSLSLFLILGQVHLFAAELSDAAVFGSAVLIACLAGFCLARLNVGVVPMAVAALASPFAARLFIMLPRFFLGDISIGGMMIALDSLLLNFDRNLFVFLLPFYWMMGCVYFSARFPAFLPGAVFASDFLLAVIFSTGKSDTIAVYEKPLALIIVIAAVVLLQILALIFRKAQKAAAMPGEKRKAALFALVFIIAGGLLALKPAEENAIGKGGGLLEPKLFSFDFAPFLRLENEISMNDNLVFIVRKKEPNDDGQYLMRRFVLSGFDAKKGWTRNPVVDEEAHPQKLPNRRVNYQKETRKSGVQVEADYFLVNIDGGAFIAFAEPSEVIPYYAGDQTSYKSAYSVVSDASGALPYELINAPEYGFSAIDFEYYTKWGGDPRIPQLARSLTEGITNYWEKTRAIYLYLKYGEYRYSLKPGTALDGDQLGQFLFGNKKGYCSYFAFAYASLLRSIGIPARIAVGFFMNHEEERLGFYPVRANMAHAWVEVFFPEFGWIAVDPTTAQLAEGENFSFGEGLPPQFESLIKEILETERIPKEGGGETEDEAAYTAGRFTRDAARFIAKNRFALLAAIAVFFAVQYTAGLYIRARLTKNKRKKAVYHYLFAKRLLSLKAYRKKAGETEADFARFLEERLHAGLYQLYQLTERARFAQEWSDDDEKRFYAAYRFFMERYKMIKRQPAARTLFFFLVVFCAAIPGRAEEADTAEMFLAEASAARMNENWEKAVELYTKGKARYPADSRFPHYLGDLYESQGLYRLALDEYRTAEARGAADDLQLLYSLAETTGHLNLYDASARYYEEILAVYPEDEDAIASLGWMYFKLHRFQEGADLLENAIAAFGDNLKFYTTLAIIYSDMYRYDDSAALYKQIIAITEAAERTSHASLAHYNYSILESRFYQYDRALAETEASLMWEKRFSGYLARGEMSLNRFAFSAAARDYEKALETDPTTLSKISLAQVRQIQGRLDEALLLAHEALDSKDLSWMLNFGINEDQYRRDIYEILYKTNQGLYYRAKNTVYAGAGEAAVNVFNRIKYYINGAKYKHLYEKYTLTFAKGFDTAWSDGFPPQPAYLEVLAQYVHCFDKYPRRAASYLAASRQIETALIPASGPFYIRSEGSLKKNTVLLEKALVELDPVWEAAEIAEAYKDAYRLYRKNGDAAKAREAAEKLYLINQGALLQNGIPLPVTLRVDFGGLDSKNRKYITRVMTAMLKKAGFAIRSHGTFTLSVYLEADNASAGIYEAATGKTIVQKAVPLDGYSRKSLARFARETAALAFIAE
jgi:transglutaminase-like putative cysteine protease/predicted Zn-dependent protease